MVKPLPPSNQEIVEEWLSELGISKDSASPEEAELDRIHSFWIEYCKNEKRLPRILEASKILKISESTLRRRLERLQIEGKMILTQGGYIPNPRQ